ncbi:MAG: hypothetical protein WEA36_01120 [Balneolaceae bacterium]
MGSRSLMAKLLVQGLPEGLGVDLAEDLPDGVIQHGGVRIAARSGRVWGVVAGFPLGCWCPQVFSLQGQIHPVQQAGVGAAFGRHAGDLQDALVGGLASGFQVSAGSADGQIEGGGKPEEPDGGFEHGREGVQPVQKKQEQGRGEQNR